MRILSLFFMVNAVTPLVMLVGSWGAGAQGVEAC